jgi:AraC-like DNA-binding protein
LFTDIKSSIFLSSRISRILEFVSQNYKSNISLDQIASEICLSKYHFERVFKNEVGIPFKQYLNALKIYKAAELLRSKTATPIAVVCFDLGFNDLSNFIRQFKQFIGCSPIQYKNCHINPRLCPSRKNSLYFNFSRRKITVNKILNFQLSQICYWQR